MASRSKAVSSNAVPHYEFCIRKHALSEFLDRGTKEGPMRFWLYVAQSVAVVIVLWGTLASIPAFAQLPPPTTVDMSLLRTPSELVTLPDGGTLDLITYGGTASFTVRVTNTGMSRAYAVKLRGTAPTGPTPNPDGGLIANITAITPGGTTCSFGDAGATFSCNFGDLPDGQLADGGFLASASASATYTISLPAPVGADGGITSAIYGTAPCTLADGGPIADNPLGATTATASADNASMQSDGGLLSAGQTYQKTLTRPLADLAVTMTGPEGAKEGDTVTFNVHGVNNGPCVANRPRLTNTLPNTTLPDGGLLNGLLVFQSNSGDCQLAFPNPSSGSCTVVNGSWPVGASFNVASTYTVGHLPADVPTAALQNAVALNSSSTTSPFVLATPDPIPSNNAATTNTWINHPTGGCNAVTGSTLGLFGIALAILTLRRRRRNP
jgi:uncharacterized repeat protein (TIGR01451 family)/MYXO-CTERM domain-containing protein